MLFYSSYISEFNICIYAIYRRNILVNVIYVIYNEQSLIYILIN